VKPVKSGYETDCLTIPTVVRAGLKEDAPDVYRLVKNFSLGTDINDLMLRVEVDGEDVSVVAADWISKNQDKIDQWLGK
jgi:glycine betaine/proline transport system substrate-binding protein